MQRILEKIEKSILIITIFLIPIVIFPFFINPFLISKNLILVFGIILVLIIKIIRTITSGKLNFSSTNYDFPIILISLAYIASTVFISPSKSDAYFIPGSTLTIVSLGFLFFLINQSKIIIKEIKNTLLFSSVTFSVISLLSILKILEKIPQLPNSIKSASFNVTGGLIPAIVFLITVFPLLISLFNKEKHSIKKIFNGVLSLFLFFCISILIYGAVSDKNSKIVLPSFQNSWYIAAESLKLNPILGSGSGNYINAFNKFRPLDYNSTEYWSIKLNSARNYYLTVLTETGLLGIIAYIILFAILYKNLKLTFKKKPYSLISFLIISASLAFLPSSISLLMLFIVVLSIISEKRKLEVNLSFNGNSKNLLSKFPAFLVSLPFIALICFVSFFGSKLVLAEYKFNQAGQALAKNDAKNTYSYIQEAIKINPRVDRYHLSFSQVSFAIANSIARQEKVSDSDKETLTKLVQQAISEGKAAITINRFKFENWSNLATLYRSIMPFAQGSDQFAIESYKQAINLDPINPQIRLSLGGIYYALGNYDEAIKTFELAIVAKPDYANAHYNLGAAYREKGQNEKAIQQFKIALSLVTKDSPDYILVNKEIENLENKKAVDDSQATENITPPVEAEKPVINPPLELPEEAAPPIPTQE